MIRLSTIAIGLMLGLNLLASNAARSGVTRRLRRLRDEPAGGKIPALATWPVWGRLLEARGPISSARPRPTRSTSRRWSKWNKALRARQAALREDKQKQEAKENAALAARVDRRS